MIAGHLQIKNDYYYMVLSYTDSDVDPDRTSREGKQKASGENADRNTADLCAAGQRR